MTLFIGNELVSQIRRSNEFLSTIKRLPAIAFDDASSPNTEQVFAGLAGEVLAIAKNAERALPFIATQSMQQGVGLCVTTDEDAVFLNVMPQEFSAPPLEKIFSQLKSKKNIQVQLVIGENAWAAVIEIVKALHALPSEYSIFITAQSSYKKVPEHFAFSLAGTLVAVKSALRISHQAIRQAVLLDRLTYPEAPFDYPFFTVGYAEQHDLSDYVNLSSEFLTACLSLDAAVRPGQLANPQDVKEEARALFQIREDAQLEILCQFIQSPEAHSFLQTALTHKLLRHNYVADRYTAAAQFKEAIECLEKAHGYFNFLDEDATDDQLNFDRLFTYLTASKNKSLASACVDHYLKIAQNYLKLDEIKDESAEHIQLATTALNNAEKIVDQVLPNELKKCEEVAAVKEQLAKPLARKAGDGLLEQGREVFRQKSYSHALTLFQQAAACFHRYHTDLEFLFELAKCYSNMARCYNKLNATKDCDNQAKQAIQTYLAVSQQYSDLYQSNLSEEYLNQSREAEKKAESMYDLFFTGQDDKKKMIQLQQGANRLQQAKELFMLKQYSKALVVYTEALDYFKPYVKEDKLAYLNSGRCLMNSALCQDCVGRGAALKENYKEHLRQHTAAFAAVTEALEIFETCLADTSGKVTYPPELPTWCTRAAQMRTELDNEFAAVSAAANEAEEQASRESFVLKPT